MALFSRSQLRRASPADLLLYLTDGYGRFPAEPPDNTVLWAVPPGAAEDETFRFGTLLRLVD